MLNKNETIALTITDMSSDGSGIGKYNDIIVFVPFSAVGDELLVKIVKVHKTYVYAIIQQIITPSDSRILPECEIYGKCGGCLFAHITYKAELKAKRSFAMHAMQRIGGINAPVQETLASPQEARYRNKVQFPVCISGGQIKSGFYASRSHRVIVCDDCRLQPRLLNNIAKTCCRIFEKFNIPVYDEKTRKGLLRHIYLRYGETSGSVLLCFVINGNNLPHSNEICAEILDNHSEVKSIVININTQNTNVILGKKCRTLHGTGFISDEVCGVPVMLDAMSFYQVNKKGAELLYKTAADMAQLKSDDILLDLYCGTGTIGLAMMKTAQFKQLVGVEIVPEAVESARQNALKMGITGERARFICADTASAMQALVEEGLTPTAVVLDPPRKGCDETTLNAIVTMAPRQIVMISCNVATAARDAKYLEENGYKVKEVAPVDLFPRTKHVEVIVLLDIVNTI